jgi:hypothetical protein
MACVLYMQRLTVPRPVFWKVFVHISALDGSEVSDGRKGWLCERRNEEVKSAKKISDDIEMLPPCLPLLFLQMYWSISLEIHLAKFPSASTNREIHLKNIKDQVLMRNME